jgi:hypothetical protein
MPLQATSGAASYDAFGGGVPVGPNYIENVFSTWLYTGTGATQTITNSIDLSTKGGLVWIKGRSGATANKLTDTSRGVTKALITSSTAAQTTDTTGLTAFGTTGFTIGADSSYNTSAATYVSWTLRKQPKFFDIVTYTGTGSAQAIAHNLGSVPGCIIVKCTNAGGSTNFDWAVYHASQGSTKYLRLNTTATVATGSALWNNTDPTSTQFTVGSSTLTNTSGGEYVAYVFAHDAGGFGLTGTDNVISCSSFTTNGSGQATVSLGYEPQWLLVKRSNSTGNWFLVDNMRGFTVTNSTQALYANLSDAEVAINTTYFQPNSTGFFVDTGGASQAYIYIAIRRGPMKVPTSGTSVFGLNARTGTGANATVTGGQTDDAVLIKNRGSAVASLFSARLTATNYLVTSSTAAQVAAGVTILQANPWDVMDGVKVGTTSTITNASANTYINYLFKRAPSFMDVVCYTGTSVARTISHNLSVVPELMIVKDRSRLGTVWVTYAASQGNTKYADLSDPSAFATDTYWNNTSPTSSVFSVSALTDVNSSGDTYVAYLFATCSDVSKVGSYTGNGTTQTIDCGLTAGARFVLIKRTDASGAWYIYDTARGMTLLTDPYWLANTTAAEVATLGSVTTVATGFAVDSTILAAINVNAGTYLFLAIA